MVPADRRPSLAFSRVELAEHIHPYTDRSNLSPVLLQLVGRPADAGHRRNVEYVRVLTSCGRATPKKPRALIGWR